MTDVQAFWLIAALFVLLMIGVVVWEIRRKK